VQDRLELVAGGSASGVEIETGRWHTLAALEADTVVFEVKQGPCAPHSDKDFAAWAPAEVQPRTDRFLEWFRQAQPGDHPPETR